ncbi:DUF7093 family protein [Halomicrococcus sp. SG-WS-1]|uniref:DUF7093 family protein n=1 Tax=Halomicrococcus sp. SG-WS-1 TaxID=3439057 RepID=UPI003F7AB9F3
MGLRCSLLGHDYAESEIEREREEDGNEVVVTVREFKECKRCGERSVVSENKEVTAIEDPEPNPEPPESEAVDTEPAESVATSDGESTELSDDFEPPETAEEDDGVILDDEDDVDEEPAGRGHGEWPESDDHGQDSADRSHGEWPESDADDEGFDAQVDDGEDADVQFGGGLTPEADLEAEEDVQFVEAEPRESATSDREQDDTGFTRARAAPQPDQATTSNPDGELVCPECGNVDEMADSSLRAGDICPECRKGYLSERD